MLSFITRNSYILSQIAGFAAMGTGILMYQFKKHRVIMFLQILCGALWCLSFVFLGQLTPVVINLVNVVRGIVFSFRDRKWCRSPVIPALFCLSAVIILAVTYSSVLDHLTLVGSVFASAANWQKNTKRLKLLTVPVCLSWFFYNLLIPEKNVSGMCNEVLILGSIAFFFIRIAISEKNNKSKEGA